MCINLYGIWDNLSKKMIRFFVSDNDETCLREFSNFIIEVKQKSPMINTSDFEIYNMGEYKSDSTTGKMVTNGKTLWENFEKEFKKVK